MAETTHEWLLLRHAEAALPHGKQDDFDRALTRKGEAAARALHDWLVARALRVDEVLCSPAVRARSTLTLVLPAQTDQAQLPPALYLADADTIIASLRAQPARGRLLLIGHNPGLELAAAQLCGWMPPRSLAPGALLRLAVAGDGRCALLEAWSP